jgi:hypothetical protein
MASRFESRTTDYRPIGLTVTSEWQTFRPQDYQVSCKSVVQLPVPNVCQHLGFAGRILKQVVAVVRRGAESELDSVVAFQV